MISGTIIYKLVKKIRFCLNLKFAVSILSILPTLIFVSCEKEIAKIKIYSSAEELPSGTAEGFEMLIYDSTLIRSKLQTPELIRHENGKEPYTEFPKGILIMQYDARMKVISNITAQYAKYFETDERWEAKNNVVAVNINGDTLKTEYLVWDTRKGKISSDQFVKIIRKDQIITGIGLESNQDFSNYEIKNIKGHIYINVDK